MLTNLIYILLFALGFWLLLCYSFQKNFKVKDYEDNNSNYTYPESNRTINLARALSYEKTLSWAIVFADNDKKVGEILNLYLKMHQVTLDICEGKKHSDDFDYLIKKYLTGKDSKYFESIYEDLIKQAEMTSIPKSFVEPLKLKF